MIEAKTAKVGDSIRGHCPECGPNRFAKVVGAHQTQEADREHQAIWEIKDYYILKCAGCERVYFQATTLGAGYECFAKRKPVRTKDDLLAFAIEAPTARMAQASTIL